MIKKTLLITCKIAFVVAAFYWILEKVNAKLILENISSISIVPLFFSYLALHVSLFFSSLRSRNYFMKFGLELRRTFCICLYYVGTMFNIILPGGISGDGYKVYLISKRTKFSKLKALRIIFYERVNGIYPLIFLGLLFSLYSNITSIIPSWFIIILLVIVTPCYLLGAIYILRDNYCAALSAIKYSFIVQIFQVISAILLVSALIQTADFQTYIDFILLFIIGSIVSIIPISIGGAGLRELTFFYGVGFLSSAASQEVGVAFAIMAFVLYVLTAVVGIPIFLYLKNIRHIKA